MRNFIICLALIGLTVGITSCSRGTSYYDDSDDYDYDYDNNVTTHRTVFVKGHHHNTTNHHKAQNKLLKKQLKQQRKALRRQDAKIQTVLNNQRRMSTPRPTSTSSWVKSTPSRSTSSYRSTPSRSFSSFKSSSSGRST